MPGFWRLMPTTTTMRYAMMDHLKDRLHHGLHKRGNILEFGTLLDEVKANGAPYAGVSPAVDLLYSRKVGSLRSPPMNHHC